MFLIIRKIYLLLYRTHVNNMEYEIYSLFVNIHISYRVPIVFDKNVFLNIRHVLQIKIDKTCSK